MAREVRTSPYGSWRSPVTADAIVAGAIGLSQIQLDGDDIYWVEQRPAEAGRNVVVRRRAGGVIDDITPAGFNARTRVHEYGGGAYLVKQGTVWFSNFADQRLYRQDPGLPPIPITPEKDYLNRRTFLRAGVLIGSVAATGWIYRQFNRPRSRFYASGHVQGTRIDNLIASTRPSRRAAWTRIPIRHAAVLADLESPPDALGRD